MMAAEPSNMSMNGGFVSTQPHNYVMPDQSTASHSAANSLSAAPDYVTASNMQSANNNGAGNADIPKDEVGWYFVEQYYTTMSRTPEKLHYCQANIHKLFYNKRSQFVSGAETEKVNVCIGQKAVNERIKELDIQDCKVRVTNVDSQGSGQNIVIQVIGEMSNKSAPQRKFTQTFVLAEQTNGYFVLNDIFRYVVDEEEEYEGEDHSRAHEAASGYQEPAGTVAPGVEPHTLTNSENAIERERDAQMVDEGLEQAIQEDPISKEAPPPAAVNGGENVAPVNVVEAEDTPAAAIALEEPTVSHVEAPEAQTEDLGQSEQPMAPEQTPAISPPKPMPPQPVSAPAPAKPAAPKTWANLVAANNKASSAAPTQSTATAAPPASAPTQPKSASSMTTQVPTAPAAVSQEVDQPPTPQSAGSEWQTARHDHGKKQTRPQAPAVPPDNTRAYIKNIGENIDQDMLRSELSKFGILTYLDINRQKASRTNCAFADFSTPAGYQAAVSANPHELGGERIYVEERRIRPQSFGGYPRGGPAGRGRGGMDGRPGGQGRGGFKDGNRGGFTNRGRGNVNPRGRGVPQTA